PRAHGAHCVGHAPCSLILWWTSTRCPSRRGSIMSVLLWVLFGLIVGLIAKLLTPGREPGGFVVTALIGMAGSVVGGLLGRAIGLSPSSKSTGGLFMSILGAVILLAIYHAAIGRRATR